jgi:isoquinoline 1-oxidoreductase subunit beta
MTQMNVQRRSFLVGGSCTLGAAMFSLETACSQQSHAAPGAFSTWLRIGLDDAITIFMPHIDFGQGAHNALAQMLADELDADWSKVTTQQAPAELAFANDALVRATAATSVPRIFRGAANSLAGFAARRLSLQMTGGSSSIQYTGQYGMRTLGASVRLAMLSVAANRLAVPVSQLTTANSIVTHAPSGRSLRYGELAIDASKLSLSGSPKLKSRDAFKIIGQSPARADITGKVDGSAQYGLDFSLPNMRVATIMAAPVRGGKLTSVDEAPALAIAGVETVVKLENAVIVVGKGYWQATKGLRALAPVFSDGGQGQVSSTAIFQAQADLLTTAKPPRQRGAAATADAKKLDVRYQVPFLHQATMEPFCLVAHREGDKIQVWGGTQDPLTTKMIIVRESGLKAANVTFHPMIMGGGFGRRFPDSMQVIGQVVKLAMQVPYPVKLIWSREEDVSQGGYRPQASARMQGTLAADGTIASWVNNYAQPTAAQSEAALFYTVPNVQITHAEHKTNQQDSFWRSVHHSQHGFFTEAFMNEMAELAGADALAFRLKHLTGKDRHIRLLNDVATRSGWAIPLPTGQGRGIAIVESFGTIVANVIEVSVDATGTPKVHKVFAAVDCGTTINPRNAQAQIMGSIVMGLSAALGEGITLDKGAVVQKNFNDYPVLRLADAPAIDIKFFESDGAIGGLGEPGLPPVAPALAGALFMASAKRHRQLPIISQA